MSDFSYLVYTEVHKRESFLFPFGFDSLNFPLDYATGVGPEDRAKNSSPFWIIIS